MPHKQQIQYARSIATPLIALSALMLLVVSISFLFAYQQGDQAAAERQATNVKNALRQQGKGFERELKLETIWGDAFINTALAPDPKWMDQFYGEYLSGLLGYDEIYVLDGSNRPIYGYEDGKTSSASSYTKDEADISDLVAAIRAPEPGADVTQSVVDLGDLGALSHRSISDVRNVGGRPVNVTVETILPDASPSAGWRLDGPPPLLVATHDLDAQSLTQLGRDLTFSGLRWLGEGAPKGAEDMSTELLASDGKTVGTLIWRKDLPGQQLLTRMSTGLGVAFLLLVLLGVLAGRAIRSSTLAARDRIARAHLEARTDFITQLPNRLALSEEAARRLQSLGSGEFMAVITVDITGLRRINDHFGHAAGDEALKAVGARLRDTVPAGYVARMGGDEFAILLDGKAAETFAQVADNITSVLGTSMQLPLTGTVQIGASTGYTIAPLDGDLKEELFRRADLALSRARKEGAGVSLRFDVAYEAAGARRLAIETRLRRAIAENAFTVAYQPLVDANSGNIAGAEALARWTDAELGPISPTEFIAVAEETGLIVSVGEHIMRQALRDAAAWPGLVVSVNVSAVQIQRSDVPALVARLLDEYQFPAARLEIELTESSLVSDEGRANEQITLLQKLGVKVALDDFGTGYASLLYLRQFGFDKLKIDQKFVRDIDTSVEARAMVISITTMCKTLGLQVTAEGVENADQVRFLTVAGVDRLQGYRYSAPIPGSDFARLVGKWRAAA